MAEDRKAYMIKDSNLGVVQISDDVIATIAGIAATEIDGVSSMAGNLTNDIIGKLGVKSLSKGVHVEVLENVVSIDLALNLTFGSNIPKIVPNVQEKVKAAVENMTGLEVADVNVKIVGIEEEK